MKINQNPTVQSTTPSQVEQTPATTNAGVVQTNPEVTRESAAQMQRSAATEAKGFMNFSADFARAQLFQSLDAVQNPARIQTTQVNQAAKELLSALPNIISKSGNDPDQFLKGVKEQVSSSIGYRNLGSMNDGDIMAMAFSVIMEAAKSAREDLKSIMESVKSINDAKADFRELLSKFNENAARTSDSDAKRDDDP